MDKNTPAYWSLSLDTECPKCGHNFDLLCDPDFWEFLEQNRHVKK
ncbi:hypothetical protein ACRRJ0_004321 [Escherichia coli]